ncbi:MAG TPA: hypothetical protein VK123_10915, partial [Candidatus Limnocylindrales bacterium]|nr:hypothetical protein [Candidatus Limnocylindrales bacterium]
MLPGLKQRLFGPLRGAVRARGSRARASAFGVCGAVAAAWLVGWAAPALAVSGSGTATPSPAGLVVVAGTYTSFTINYAATENFARPEGGVVEVWIPSGWTPPQTTDPTAHGYVTFSNGAFIDSVITVGQRIRLRIGKGGNHFNSADQVGIHYGLGGPPQSARVDTAAPQTAMFLVLSQPQVGDVLTPLTAGSPTVSIVPEVVVATKIVDAAIQDVAAIVRTTDQDTTQLYLRGYDQYGNSARWVSGVWSLSGGIGSPAPASGIGTILSLTTVGTGKAYADSGAWRDSTGVITVTNGAYASLAPTSAGTGTAGSSFGAAVESRDADGNRMTSGAGSGAPVRFVAFTDSLGSTAADPSFTNPNATLAAGVWGGMLTPQRSGTFFLAARDTLTGLSSTPRARLVVASAPPDHIVATPDTLRLTAGVPDTVTVTARDVFDNPSAFSADEELTLWTDRPQGRFESLTGTQVFSLTIPAGSDSARVRFVDTQATTAEGRIRAIDANGVAPFVGTAGAPVYTVPDAPAGVIALTATPGSLTADGVDSSHVTSLAVHDAFANVVAAGERFTVTGSGVTVMTDADPGTPGFQWTAAADGTLSGWVRAGTAAGPASMSVVSERGSASGSVGITLGSGAPSGAIALTASPDSVAADGVATRAVSASGLHDAFSNAVLNGEAYTVATTLGSITTADADAGTPGVQVLASGGAISFTLLGGSVLGTTTVSATSVRGSAAGSVNVRLVPGAVSAATSSVAATSPVAVGAPGSVLTITLRDGQGHALAGVPSGSIVVVTSGLATTRIPLAPATDASGAIGYSVKTTSVGSAGILVTAGGVPLADSPTIQFVHGELDTLVVTGPAGPLTAGVQDSLTVTARDPFGNAMPDLTDLVHATALSGAASGLPATVALSGGSAVIRFTPTAASPLTIRVADDSSHATLFGPVAVRSGAPYRLTADPPATDTLQAGGSVPVRAQVVDAYGNAAGGAAVAASVVAGGGGVAPGAGVTDASGAADFVLQAGSTPGIVTLRLVATGSAAPDPARSDSVSVVVIPSTVASVQIAASDTLRAGDFLSFTLTLRDAFGNVTTGATPTVTLDTSTSLPDSISWALGAGASGSLVDNNPTDDVATYTFAVADSGRAALRVRATRAETIRLTVSGAGSPVQSGNVAVIHATATILAVDPLAADTLQSGGSVPVRARVADAYGNVAAGDTVVASVVLGGGGVVPAADVTDASGAADFVLQAGVTPGAVTLRLVATGSTAPDPVRSDSVSVVVVSSVVASVQIAAGDTLGAGDFLSFTLTLRDPLGNVAVNATPTLTLDTSTSLPDSISWGVGAGASGALVDNGPADDVATYTFAVADSGRAALRVRATRAETIRLTVSGAGSPVQSGNIVVIPAAAATLAILSGQGQTAVVNQELALPLRVSARDAFQNLVPGATVTFRVVAGGGFVDAIRGGAADSTGVTNGSGVAACDVARVGTVAGASNNRYRAALPAPGDSAFFDASATPDAATTIALSPGSLSLAAGGAATVTATARDAHGNAAPGTSITFYLGSPPAGSLASLGPTSGSGTTQVGLTDPAGQIYVSYQAPASAPASDVIYARGTTIAPISINATIAPAGAASLVVLPDASTWTAGVPARVVVRALDAGGNVATGDTATIVMGATDPVTFSPAFGALSGGEFVTFATDTLADTLRVTAATASGTESAASGVITVSPSAPAGGILIVAGRTQLTADGKSATGVTFGPVRDAYGNLAPLGTLLTVSADSLLASDASAAPGLQIATGADNLARAILVAPLAAGLDTVRAATVPASATGQLAIQYLAPPALARAGPVSPSVVAPGQSIAFAVDVTNTAPSGAVTIGTSSVFAFGAGPAAFAASPGAAIVVPAGATRTLTLAAATISASLTPGTYAPSLRLIGTDATGDAFDFFLSLAGEQVHLAGIRVVAVSAAPNPVPLGYQSLVLTFRVDNLAGAAAVIDAVALAPATLTVNGTAPALPAALPALG